METIKRLAITCGGTGGHFNPGLSVAQELQRQGGTAVLLLGGVHSEKQMKIAEAAGVKAVRLNSVKLEKSPLKMPGCLIRLLKDIFLCKKVFREEKVQALLSMGSYTSLPPFLASRLCGLPFFLHDGNARLGKANLFMSRFARSFAFSFPSVNSDKVKCPSVLTGFPLRAQLLENKVDKATAVAEINKLFHMEFDAEKPVLLTFGGSLGAKKINTCISLNPETVGAGDLQFIHLSGPGRMDETAACYAELPNRSLVLESFENIGLLYSAADFVISRAGGSTVSELAYFGKYAILIPYPFAAELHQNDNAAWLASAGGAKVIFDDECSKEKFAEVISSLLVHRDECMTAGRKNLTLAQPTAADNVLKMISENI